MKPNQNDQPAAPNPQTEPAAPSNQPPYNPAVPAPPAATAPASPSPTSTPVPPPSPVAAPAQPTTPSPWQNPEAEAHRNSTAVQVVWQWLTYTLWSWALCALAILLSGVLTFWFVSKSYGYEFLIYSLAALIVLLPLAYFADKYYRKIEPDVKHGFPAVVMVLNAVIIFLVAIAGLITAVISLFTMFVSTDENSGKLIAFMSAGVVATLGMLLFFRIIRPPKYRAYVTKFPKIVVLITGVTIVMAFIGPFVREASRKSDKIIESGLPSVNTAVQDYARKNKKLPDDLSSLSPYNSDGKKLIEKNKVEYRIISQVNSGGATILPLNSNSLNSSTSYNRSVNNSNKGEYELCVTYSYEKKEEGYNDYYDDYSSRPESNYISTYTHKAGRQCYTQSVTIYRYDY